MKFNIFDFTKSKVAQVRVALSKTAMFLHYSHKGALRQQKYAALFGNKFIKLRCRLFYASKIRSFRIMSRRLLMHFFSLTAIADTVNNRLPKVIFFLNFSSSYLVRHGRHEL